MSNAVRTFVLRPLGGWGARFAMIGAAHLFAKKHERRLRVWWTADTWPDWNDVFATPLDLVSAVEARTLVLNDRDVLHEWTDERGASDAPLLTAQTAWYPRGSMTKDEAFTAFVNTFAFNAKIRAAGFTLRLPLGTIGVHVRRTDHKAATQVSKLEHFVEAMRALGPDRPFYICSDDALVKRTLLSQFPNAFATDLPSTRATLEGILSGLVEMLTLSRCQMILGSARSSFSHFPAVYGNIPLWVAGQTPLEVLEGFNG